MDHFRAVLCRCTATSATAARSPHDASDAEATGGRARSAVATSKAQFKPDGRGRTRFELPALVPQSAGPFATRENLCVVARTGETRCVRS